MSPFLTGLITLSQILVAGIGITAFSLLLYAFTFNLRDRVARAFALLLGFISVVYVCDVLVTAFSNKDMINMFLRVQWLGIAFVPVSYLHFSDALLATTGQPSRGRRRVAIRILYLAGLAFLVAALFTDVLVGEVALETSARAPHLRAGPLFVAFIAYFTGALVWAGWNFWRAYRRCQTSTTRRRMLYLMISAAAPPLGTFPFLLLAGQTVALHPVLFWILAILTNFVVAILLLVLAYTVAYFGVALPDRVVKARFFQWLLRGPVVVSTVAAIYLLVTQYGPRVAGYDTRMLPILLIGTLLIVQYVITLVRLPIERALFYGADRLEIRRLQTLEERLLTTRDLQQFFESVLAAVCDVLRSPSAFLVAFGPDGRIDDEVAVGSAIELRMRGELPPLSELRSAPVDVPDVNGAVLESLLPGGLFAWGNYWLVPLRGELEEVLGLLGVQSNGSALLTADELLNLSRLCARAAIALEDRRLQRDVFTALDQLLPEIETVQRLRASTTFPNAQSWGGDVNLADVPQMVRDALKDFWGGPRLTESPLLRLRVVQQAIDRHDGNTANALRAVLSEAVEKIKPEGQRKTTTEWLLYNILEMKFLQGERVRDVATRLAVSEADLYRKQRVALEKVAGVIIEMEQAANREKTAV